METTLWQSFDQEEVIVAGVSNTNNQNVINSFVAENSLTFPIIYDTGSSGGVQGGDIYDLYYMPNDGSPYPRDFIINQDGIISYANNEVDTEWMLDVINDLLDYESGMVGDLNQDSIINILDVISIINIILLSENASDYQLWASDLNEDNITNILDVISLVNIILI